MIGKTKGIYTLVEFVNTKRAIFKCEICKKNMRVTFTIGNIEEEILVNACLKIHIINYMEDTIKCFIVVITLTQIITNTMVEEE